MSEENTTASEQPAVNLQIVGQFIRDLSFENIYAQKGANADGRPNVSVEVSLDAKARADANLYEVITKLKVESKTEKDDVLFVLELDYAGIFKIENVLEEQMHAFLMIECPRQLFPFLRRIVHDVTRDGGFPPLNLDQIDFVSIYRQDIARRVEKAKAEEKAN